MFKNKIVAIMGQEEEMFNFHLGDGYYRAFSMQPLAAGVFEVDQSTLEGTDPEDFGKFVAFLSEQNRLDHKQACPEGKYVFKR